MRKTFLLFLAIVSFQFCFGQITEGNWLVGGLGQFSAHSSTNTNISPASEQTIKAFNIIASPNIGYFIKDKFAVGLRPSLNWERNKGGNAVAPDGTI